MTAIDLRAGMSLHAKRAQQKAKIRQTVGILHEESVGDWKREKNEALVEKLLCMKRQGLLFVIFLLSMTASAYDAKINGIYFNFDFVNNTAEVSLGDDYYSGRVNIPSRVIYNSNDYHVTSIGNAAFADCEELTFVNIPSSVVSIGNSAFDGCIRLSSISMSSSVTSIGNRAFADCDNLRSLILPNSLTSIGTDAFQNCRKLTSVNIPYGLTSISRGAFMYCVNLTNVTIPNSVTTIDDRAFDGCELTTLNIPSSVTSIGSYAFAQNHSLVTVTIPNSVTSIGDAAFWWCNGLTNVTLGNSIETIGDGAFANCAKLTSIIIPDAVTTIGERAFQNCSSLESVKILAMNPPVVYDDSFNKYDIPLYVPESSFYRYNNQNPWKKFAPLLTLTNEDIMSLKCAKPTISFIDGELVFKCETEDVTFHYTIRAIGDQTEVADKVSLTTLTTTYEVAVYANKKGYLNSDVSTKVVKMALGNKGDMNDDGVISITDVIILLNKILESQ